MKIIKNIILIILIVILIYVMYCKFVRKDELINLFGKSFLIVTTGSMEPTIEPEELIIISKSDKYEINDIVTYKDEDNYFITHRIIDIKGNKFIARGDSNNLNDYPCNIDKIQGKVIFNSKILGIFVLYYLKPCIIIYVVIIILFECFKSLKNSKKINSKSSVHYKNSKLVNKNM